jgi:cyclopropane-fatty-acyl-phospholipid synthase
MSANHTRLARAGGGRAARAAVTALLGRLRSGRLHVLEGGRRRSFGPPGSDLQATVTVHDPAAWRWVLRGSLGLGESYVGGAWDADDLVAFFRIVLRELRRADRAAAMVARPRAGWHRLRRLVPANTRTGARRHIAAHYDLGNELFEAFLDQRMLYSCALFERPDASLEEAQLAKLRRICGLLELGPENHLLEIGSGWGGLAIHAASEHGCRVTTATISRRQHELAGARVREAGVEHLVDVRLSDYRDLRGSYDRLVSVEMIEAVGWQYFDAFFASCSRLLRADGLMLLQAITIDDRLYESEKAARSFANTHIFPGGCLPSAARMARSVTGATDLRQTWMEEITSHYPPTLAAWRERFLAAWPKLRRLGYDEGFRRLWLFYLSSSEAGFAEGRLGDVQILYAKPGRRTEAGAARRSASLAGVA